MTYIEMPLVRPKAYVDFEVCVHFNVVVLFSFDYPPFLPLFISTPHLRVEMDLWRDLLT